MTTASLFLTLVKYFKKLEQTPFLWRRPSALLKTFCVLRSVAFGKVPIFDFAKYDFCNQSTTLYDMWLRWTITILVGCLNTIANETALTNTLEQQDVHYFSWNLVCPTRDDVTAYQDIHRTNDSWSTYEYECNHLQQTKLYLIVWICFQITRHNYQFDI